MEKYKVCYNDIYFETVLSPGDGHWGAWTRWNTCPDGSYVKGFRLRFEPRQGGSYDDSGLNAVQIKCQTVFGNQTK